MWKVINGFQKRSDLIYRVKELRGRETSFGKETIAVVQVTDQVAWSLVVALEVRRGH